MPEKSWTVGRWIVDQDYRYGNVMVEELTLWNRQISTEETQMFHHMY